jgi:hypothetical protein
MDRDNINNLYKEHSIDVTYQISVYLGKRFQTEDLLEINQSKTGMVCGGHVCYRIGTK